MLEEFEKSVKATLYDRLASPLIGSYVTAWCVFNYKIILIILSDLQYTQKSEYIDALFTPWWNYPVRYGIPLLWSAFYIFAYPHAAKFVFRKWQKYIKAKRDIKHEIEGTRLLTLEESEAIRTEYLQSENKLAELMQNNKKELQEWKDKYDLLMTDYLQLKGKYKPTPAVLSEEMILDEPEISAEAYNILKKIIDSKDINIHRITTSHRDFLKVGNNEIQLDNNADMYLAELVSSGLIAHASKNRYMLKISGVEYMQKMEKINKIVLPALPKEAAELLKQIVATKENVFQVRDFDQSKVLFFGNNGRISLEFNKEIFLKELVERGFLKVLPDDQYMLTEAGYNFANNLEQTMKTSP